MRTQCVTVSVVSHEHGTAVCQLLEDIAEFSAKEVAKVVLTLNVPEDGLACTIKARAWPFEVQTIVNLNPLGYGSNHNQAFSYCNTPYFCVVNPDIRLTANPFSALIDALQTPDAGCAYPMQSTDKGAPLDLAREAPSPLALMRRYMVPSYGRGGLQPREWVNGSFMLFVTGVYARLGGFDQRYFMYCEDVDICLRLRQQGFKLVPAIRAHVLHVGHHASRRQWRHFWWHVGSLIRLWMSESYRSS